jgi:tetratricopeptide (TPR) repeat protein
MALVVVFFALTTSIPARGATYARVHHPVSTSNAAAQADFDQGLTLLYAFSREASRHAFQAAAKADPNLAMAWWGVAMSYGSNINVSIDAAGEKAAVAAIGTARTLAATKATAEERALIGAASVRYSTTRHADLPTLDRAYSSAMRSVMHAYPDDDDVAVLFAESAMDLRPWALYTVAGAPVSGTAEIVSTLEATLARSPNHIGANHLYIHATEASLQPGRALVSAMRLRAMNFEPAAAHLVHMPAHTLMRVGDYAGAVAVNSSATMHDRMYLKHNNDVEGGYYFGHNLFFLASAGTMNGDYPVAARAANDLAGLGVLEPKLFVALRFSRWSDLLAIAQPKSSPFEPLRLPVWHFARGMALAANGRTDEARAELTTVQQAFATLKVPSIVGFYNGSRGILGVAKDLLGAKLAWAAGDHPGAIAMLRDAVAIQDQFYYIEPPDWYGPAREALGAALLSSGNATEAERVFRDDLARNPRNPRSLFGLVQALRSKGESDDAGYVQASLNRTWVGAPLKLSDLF